MNARLSWILPSTLIAIVLLAPSQVSAGQHSFGGGVRYWKTLDNLDEFDDISEDGYSLMGSYRFQPKGLLSFEFDLELYDEDFGGADDAAWAPQALVLFGHGLYIGAGAGVLFAEVQGNDTSDTFYLLRGGFDFPILPHLRLDIFANYITNAYDNLGDVDSDAITLGANVRFTVGSRR